MARIRQCNGSNFHSGKSVCEIDYDKIKSLVLVKHGVKLDYSTADALRESCHAAVPSRAYGFPGIINWEPNGGEAQTSQVGYGPTMYNGMSARNDALTLDKFRHYQRAEILKNAEEEFDAYFIDARNNIYGLNDGTDTLAGIPVSIYPSGNDHPGASDKASLVINVVYTDVEEYMLNLDVEPLSYNANNYVMGLMPVVFESVGDTSTPNKYKLVEFFGKGDCTAKYGELIADAASSVLNGVTSATYNAADNTLTLTGSGTPSQLNPTLKAASVLCTNGIYGIEQYAG